MYGTLRLMLAVFGSAVLLKAGESAGGFSSMGLLVTVLGTATMLYGELMALRQDDLKRLLAYSTMGQVGEIFMVVGLGTWLATTGSLLHVLNHAIMKNLLFLCGSWRTLRAWPGSCPSPPGAWSSASSPSWACRRSTAS